MAVTDSLLKRALTDHETGLCNMLSLRLEVERAIEKGERYGFPISVVTVRCEGGEPSALSGLGRLLGTVVRRSDCIARIGEREFRLLLTHEDAQQSDRVAERLRELCSAAENPAPASESLRCEIGIDAFPAARDATSLLEGL